MDVQKQVRSFIQCERLIAPGDRVVVGVSGGPDSLCLLHLLCALKGELGLEVHVAHLNHQIRGWDADADAQFVRGVCAQWGIPCTVELRDVPTFARERRLAVEEAARRVRYAFLSEVAVAVRATRIAVGHNADDQSETVLMHWLRGAGLSGLRGMLPAMRITDLRLSELTEGHEALWLVRPLLQTPRQAIESYCRVHGLQPRFDRSNLDTTFYRNKLRHELLPYLEREYKPRFREILRRSAQVIRAECDLLEVLCDEAWRRVVLEENARAITLSREAWHELHLAMQRAVLRRAVQHLRRDLRDIGFQHIEAAVEVARDGPVGARATLPRDVMLIVGYRDLVVADRRYAPEPDFPALPAEMPGRVEVRKAGKTALPNGLVATVRVTPRDAMPPDWEDNPDPWRAFVDQAAVGERLYLRRRRAGDRFQPLGLGGRSKLVSELLVNAKVPAWWRDRVPLLVREDDQIVWVCGWRLDERARITDETRRVITIRLSAELEMDAHG